MAIITKVPKPQVVREKMSHVERAERRRKIIAKMNEGGDLNEVAKEFKVTPYYVRSLIRTETGGPTGRAVRIRTYEVIAALCNTDKSLTKLSRQFEQTYSSIQKIYAKCLETGIPVLERSKGRPKPNG